MFPLPKDQAEREKVRESLLNATLLVEAGAGTGKTSLLIDRLFTLLQKFDITDIAAITFTEKAAAELCDRMRNRLENELLKTKSKPDPKLLKALNNIDHAQISTIHSFALSLIRERPFETGIDPDFEHIDEEDEHALLEKLFNKELSFPNSERNEIISKFILLGGRFSQVKDLLQTLYKERELLTFFNFSIKEADISESFNRMIAETNRLVLNAREHCTVGDKGRVQIEQLAATTPSEINENAWKWLLELYAVSWNAGVKTNWDNGDLCKEQKDAIKNLKVDAQEFLESARSQVLYSLIAYLNIIIEKTESAKSELGVLSFHDYLSLSNLSLTNPNTLEYFQSHYKRLLIDEFQDTDPLQVEIAFRLATAKQVAGDIYNSPLESGRLCLIGDPKQSIYRFRRADPRIYLHITDIIGKQGSKVQISQNFRSAPGIINFVNSFFTPIWKDVSADGTDYAPIFPVEGRPDPNPSPTVVIIKQSDDQEIPSKIDETRQIEADIIAHTIHSIVNIQKWQRVQLTDEGYGTSDVNYGDIAILLPTFTGIEFYSDALEKANIPYNIEGGKGFYTRQIVRDISNCLCAIDNPADTLALMGALRSSFFGLTDDTLALWMKQSSGVMDYRLKSEGLPAEISDVLETLYKLHKERKELSPDNLIERLIELTDIIPALLSNPNTRRDAKILANVIDLARAQTQSEKHSLREFIRWFFNKLTADEKQETAPADERVDYVRLMTVHSAKGLEFPVVILPGTNWSDAKSKRNKCIVDRLNKNFEIEIGGKDNGFRTTGYIQAQELDEIAERAEKLRLLYVAMTRARDHLVLLNIKTQKPAAYSAWIDEISNSSGVYSGFPDDQFRTIIATQGDNTLDLVQQDVNILQHKTETLQLDSKGIRESKKKIFSDRQHRLKDALNQLPNIIIPSKYGESTIEIGKPDAVVVGDAAIRAGNALHRYMALTKPVEIIDLPLAKFIAKENDTSEQELIGLIQSCLRSEPWEQAIKAVRTWREAPVVLGRDNCILRGSIDLVWEDNRGSIHICDWKSGSYHSEAHIKQVNEYRSSLKRITNKEIKTAGLFYAASGQYVNIQAVQ
ncbi:UvrD-helicase domain-containing protein [bacterium]|nr:UvrD-helicase domain-containing protein [bacterium]